MPDSCPCETLWLYNPAALFGTNLLVADVCDSNNINAFTRSFLLAIVLATMLSPFMGYTGLVLVLLALIFIYGRWLFGKAYPDQRTIVTEGKRIAEAYQDMGANIRRTMKAELAFPNAPAIISTSPAATIVTRPTAANPFMNVLVNEIKYNPYRSKAASVFDPEVAVGLEDFFKTQFINDPTDVFGKSQSQRQFYTTPSTTVPNDQDSYQNWLYKIPGKTCKEGGREACSSQSGSAGGVIPWLTEN